MWGAHAAGYVLARPVKSRTSVQVTVPAGKGGSGGKVGGKGKIERCRRALRPEKLMGSIPTPASSFKGDFTSRKITLVHSDEIGTVVAVDQRRDNKRRRHWSSQFLRL